MSGYLVCKSGFGLGKVAKLMLASVVVLSSLSTNVWADKAEAPKKPVEKKKEGGLSSGSSKENSQKLPPQNYPSIITTNNTEKTSLNDLSVSIGPAQNSYLFWIKKGDVDLSVLKERISVLLNIVTNYGPGTPGFGISENIVEFFNKRGSIDVPEDIARDLCRLPSGKMILYSWTCFTDMFARFIAELLTVNAYGELPKTKDEMKEFVKAFGNQNPKDYYKSRHDSFDKIRKHISSSLGRKPNFE
ncbi:hypothetical protein BBOV_II002570 [Babesia bovis T2Bo]|uniref:Membrane protein, putative n=1 Tax=Babesia bovis TaxID=5865 RepID=A7ATF1_BABBO|nr:hypothetical protein BBOV_II002570 [Babesia bovis T2Bo]EDO06212.1 hypothetical protein BBOV_II002570 [Babesia bovis T2Bo]|eukprot:XP_001609780.1 membrane protein [Babesia bovis T2Bo]